MIGISSQYVGMIERGAQGLSVNVIMSICKKTGASADYILFGKSDSTAMISSFSGLSSEQVHIAFDMLSRVAAFVNTTDGNERMIQEVARQQEYFSDPGYEAVS
ncbi:MAG: helix-turn-helix domain-containing protein [Firmicutes bacterium]|nr:helix-turn-helix domain-containing protein [Bacillota bacterium]